MSSKKLYVFGVKNHHNGGYYVPCGTNYMLPIDGRLSKANQVAAAKEKATAAKWTTENVVGFVICTIADRPDRFDLTEQDFVSLTLSETPAEPEPTTFQIELPFMGFYESYHNEYPTEQMERELQDKGEALTDEQDTWLWDTFHDEFDYRTFRQGVANLYAHWLIHSVAPNAPIQQVDIIYPKEYNFTTDKIVVTLAEPLSELNLDYFTVNGLMYETLATIKQRYTSRSGFISFVEPTPPTPESVFVEPAYLDIAFEIYAYHKLEMDYENGNSQYLLGDLDSEFMDYMHEQYHYNDLFWQCLPSDISSFLNA